MDGINANTGKRLGGIEHLRQSIRDILTTLIGTRVMRRDYGSDLPRLVDAPINRKTISDIYAATAGALMKWEPRIQVTNVQITNAQAGSVELQVTGNYLPDGRKIVVDGIVIK